MVIKGTKYRLLLKPTWVGQVLIIPLIDLGAQGVRGCGWLNLPARLHKDDHRNMMLPNVQPLLLVCVVVCVGCWLNHGAVCSCQEEEEEVQKDTVNMLPLSQHKAISTFLSTRSQSSSESWGDESELQQPKIETTSKILLQANEQECCGRQNDGVDWMDCTGLCAVGLIYLVPLGSEPPAVTY